MGMLGSALHGPGAALAGGGGQDPQQQQQSKPCPCCDGAGQIPADVPLDMLIMKMQQADVASEGQGQQGMPPGAPQPQGGPPEASPMAQGAPPPPPSGDQGMSSYMANRPRQLSGQPVDETEALRQGGRARERMRSGGVRGGV